MNSHNFRILFTVSALLLIVLSIFIAPLGPIQIQTPFILGFIIAAVLIASYLPITRKQLMQGYIIMGIFMMIIAAFCATILIFGNSGEHTHLYEMGVNCFTGGFILTFVSAMRLRRSSEFEIQDERTKKIGAWGITYSWYLTFLFIVFALLAYALELPIPDIGTLLWLLIIIMPLSAYLFQWYFYRRGDIE